MPSSLDAGDRKLLIGAGVLLAILLVASTYLSPKQNSGRSVYPSSYSAQWDGAKAPYLLLQNLHYHVERWEQSPTEFAGTPSNEVLILAGPTQSASDEEKSAIVEFLRQGGRIVASGSGAANLLPNAPPLSESFLIEETTKFPAVLPSPLMRGAPVISMFPPENWQPKSSSQLVVYGNEETAAVITYQVGKGGVILWGNSAPLTNGGIRESGNLPFFLNSIGPPDGVRVLWDEYFHGAHGDLWSYIVQTPLLWGALQFAIVFLAIIATYSRRQGPISVPARVSRLSPLEFVETLGDLYSSAHAGSAAVRIAYQRLRFQLTRQLGLAPNAPDADLAQSAGRALAWNEQEISATLARAERATSSAKVGDADTLQLVQEMFDYASRLELRRTDTRERPSA
jgi:Domain of unknown function (DUF4350)